MAKNELQNLIEPGRYQHYKGDLYEVIGICHHTETLERLVIYKSLYDCATYGNEALWVRPLTMFTGTVEHQGTIQPRFRKL